MEELEGILKRGMLTISVTNKCPARCAHCLAESSPDERTTLTSSKIEGIYLQAKALTHIKNVVFTGGEPTELEDDLFNAISSISVDGTPVRVVTNACWATDEQHTKAMVTKFRESGLDEINYSLDDYHAIWIPPENVIRAYRASRCQGFAGVVIAVAEGPKSRYNLEWIKKNVDPEIQVTHPDIQYSGIQNTPSPDGTVYQAAVHGYSRVGRGHRMRSDLVVLRNNLIDMDVPCPEILDQIYIDSEGTVGACCGIRITGNSVLSMGNALQEELADVYARATSDVLLRAIHVLGPGWLLKLAKSRDDTVKVRDGYTNICEVCEDLTTQESAINVLSRAREEIESAIHSKLANVTIPVSA
ncbi:radical SAM/SPASM domain-containing protein [Bifidobacterium aquikefiri]|uniref:radical SAM/SPASM domain-containing protein n=1 Tax=Actinomycetes TaxID=1760 RepID=UPI0023F51B94|nr:radical SAM/SPASM domain-containing protein [Bifidobacterium aquikefiri]